MTRLRLVLPLAGALFICCPFLAHAGIGIRSVGGRAGFDVVQSEDTRRILGGQIDLGGLFGSALHVEPNFELGTGVDNRGERKRVASCNLGLKYLLEEEKSHVFGYFAGEFGVNAFSTVRFQEATSTTPGAWMRESDVRTSLNIVLIGLGRKIARNRCHVFSEVKLVLGQEESDSSFRVSIGFGFLLGQRQ